LAEQQAALRGQIELALERELPLIFHVREAFPEFFEIIGDYNGLRGVVHSFSGGPAEAQRAVAAGLHIALNGIITFTKQEPQLAAARELPTDRLLLETDCPFLSPAPHRGQTNEPARVADIAQFVANLRRQPLAELAAATTTNAAQLFGLEVREP
jgi:TatD DNase family protein